MTEHFQAVASSWVARYETHASFRARLDVVASVIGRYHLPLSPLAILDVGGGAGVFSAVASAYGSHVVCLDPSFEMLAEGRHGSERTVSLLRTRLALAAEPERIHRVAGTIDAIRNPEHVAFAMILAIAVLEYVHDPAALMATLRKRLAPGAHLIATVPNPRSPLRRIEVPLDRASAALGRRLRMRRLADRAYGSVRPATSTKLSFEDLGLQPDDVVEVVRLPLALAGVRRFLHPSNVVVVRA